MKTDEVAKLVKKIIYPEEHLLGLPYSWNYFFVSASNSIWSVLIINCFPGVSPYFEIVM